MSEARSTITVVAAVLRDGRGRVLLAERPAGKEMAGKWELPGGKVKPGESLHEALARELEEELGVRTLSSRPLLQLAHDYPERRVILHAREARYGGEPRSQEGQALRWVDLTDAAAFARLNLLEADGPIVTAMRLPARYLITPPRLPLGDVEAFLTRAAEAGIRLVQLRQPDTDPAYLGALCAAFDRVVGERSAQGKVSPTWLLGGDPAQTQKLADRSATVAGLHLPARFLAQLPHLRESADRRGWQLMCSCHDPGELAAASSGGADAAVLGPVLPTPSHPGAKALGWAGFAQWVTDLPLPVFAIGGMDDGLLTAAWEAGAQGVAGIRGVARAST
ncbi:MAG: Nudix family hydrolase [Pseudomonadota bacterium]